MSKFVSDIPDTIYNLSSYSFVEQNRKKQRGPSFASKPMNIMHADTVGPASYTIPREFEPRKNGRGYVGQGKSFVMTTKHRSRIDNDVPGPAQYFKEGAPSTFDQARKAKKGPSISGRTRLQGYSNDETPFYYNV